MVDNGTQIMYNKAVNQNALHTPRFIMAEKCYDISRLLDYYGEMLSERQRLAARLYYDDDLSLSEVAEELGISRQGVRASLKKSEETLYDLENRLGLTGRYDRILRQLDKLRARARAWKEKGEEGSELSKLALDVLRFTDNIENELD